MNASERVYVHLRYEEGLRLVAYKRSGDVWTIGYGKTGNVVEGMTCTQEQAEKWLAADVRECERFADAFLASAPKVLPGQYDAIVCFIYNFGPNKFIRSTYFKEIRAGRWKYAALEIPKWVHAYDGDVQGGLVRRRSVEMCWFMEP